MGEVLQAQRARLRVLRDEGEISDEVRRAIERDLDLEQARLDPSLALQGHVLGRRCPRPRG